MVWHDEFGGIAWRRVPRGVAADGVADEPIRIDGVRLPARWERARLGAVSAVRGQRVRISPAIDRDGRRRS
jgi:hypothetical protein